MAVYFDDKHERGNSHSPMLATYQRMLMCIGPVAALVEGIGRGRYRLNEEELLQIVRAAFSP